MVTTELCSEGCTGQRRGTKRKTSIVLHRGPVFGYGKAGGAWVLRAVGKILQLLTSFLLSAFHCIDYGASQVAQW